MFLACKPFFQQSWGLTHSLHGSKHFTSISPKLIRWHKFDCHTRFFVMRHRASQMNLCNLNILAKTRFTNLILSTARFKLPLLGWKNLLMERRWDSWCVWGCQRESTFLAPELCPSRVISLQFAYSWIFSLRITLFVNYLVTEEFVIDIFRYFEWWPGRC